jgi:competence protein ComGC
MLEYMLILLVVMSMFMIVARPFLTKMGEKFKKVGKQGFFTDDPTGAQFYYYRIK